MKIAPYIHLGRLAARTTRFATDQLADMVTGGAKRPLAARSDAGFAIEDDELAAGALALAMPIRSQEGVLAAVDISAPTSLIGRKDMVEQFGPHLLAATERVSTALVCPADTNQSPEKEP